MNNHYPQGHPPWSMIGCAAIALLAMAGMGVLLTDSELRQEVNRPGPHATMTALQETQVALSSTQDAIDGELYKIRQSVALTHEASVAERIRDLFASMTETPPPTPERTTMTHGYRK